MRWLKIVVALVLLGVLFVALVIVLGMYKIAL